jgi:hypothetical protein
VNGMHVERKLTAILCADLHGYSRLMREDEEATQRTLSSNRTVIDGPNGCVMRMLKVPTSTCRLQSVSLAAEAIERIKGKGLSRLW